MLIAAPKETFPGERRVALVPSVIPNLAKKGVDVLIESGAGEAAGFADQAYLEKGAKIAATRAEVFEQAEVVFQIRSLGANLAAGQEDLQLLRPGQVLAGMCDPLGNPQAIDQVAQTGASFFALEMIPRITRAQSMDVLSSMATIAGYRAVLAGAMELPKLFPMITYAAGMLRPARVFVIGVGVAGLRAIATAKALGGVVHAHDIRPTSKEEVQSVGAKFVELDLGENTQDAGGYAKALTEDDYQRQRELIAEVAAESDLVITTAAIPGRKSPLLVTEDAVKGMSAGSVIVDLAAERGGNCACTVADERTVAHGVTILGPTNLPSELPVHASEMYANNVVKFLLNMTNKEGELDIDLADEIIAGTLVAQGGEVVHPRIREMLELPPLTQDESAGEDESEESAPEPDDDGVRVEEENE